MAGILSGLMPGLGQFYCRQWGKGAGFLFAALIVDGALGVSEGFLAVLQGLSSGSPPDASGLALRSLPLMALAVWSIVDAVKTAKVSSRPTP